MGLVSKMANFHWTIVPPQTQETILRVGITWDKKHDHFKYRVFWTSEMENHEETELSRKSTTTGAIINSIIRITVLVHSPLGIIDCTRILEIKISQLEYVICLSHII